MVNKGHVFSESAGKLIDFAKSSGYWDFFRDDNTKCLVMCLLDGADEVSTTKDQERWLLDGADEVSTGKDQGRWT